MDTLRQDLRFAFRLLWKDRSFAATVIFTMTLCIGANAAIFTVVRSVLLRPLAYPEADRLVFSYDSFPGAGVERAGTSVPNYFDRVSLMLVHSGRRPTAVTPASPHRQSRPKAGCSRATIFQSPADASFPILG